MTAFQSMCEKVPDVEAFRAFLADPAVKAKIDAGRKLTGYHRIIFEATGYIDRADLDEIEDTMRHVIFHSTLDWQSRRVFCDGAREAVEVCLALGRIGPSPL